MKRLLLMSLALAWGIASAQTADQMNAFNAGKAAGDSNHTQDMFNNVNNTQAGNSVSGYSQTPPTQSSYWGGQNTVLNNLYTGGNGKVSECGSGTSSTAAEDQQHCEAVNSIMKTQADMPTNLVTRSDPVMLQGKTIAANPDSIAGAIDGNYSNCTTSQKAKDPAFTMQTCDDWSQNQTQSCTMGQEVTVDPDYIYSCTETLSTINHGSCTYGEVIQVRADFNYQCQKTDYQVNQQTCHKTLTVQANTVPGCTPGAFIVRVTADPCPRCYDYLAWDFFCQNGYYQQHFYTMYHNSTTVYMDFGWANITGAPGTNIPQTQGVSNMNTGAGYCFQTYYSQTCGSTTCTMGSWFYNPCQGTSYYGATNFSLPTRTTFTDVWNDQCTTLNGRTQ